MLCPWIVLQDTCLSLSSDIVCMMCTSAYEYIYIYACVKCLAGDGVTNVYLAIVGSMLRPVINFYHAS